MNQKAIFGALIGSKLLAWVESPQEYFGRFPDWHRLLGGKTIVGGLLGGWVGVEIAKKIVGIKHATGDLYIIPLIFGMAVGRIGCFLTGLSDQTYGVHCSLPWAVDFGDGPRHPTQLYDIVLLTILGFILHFTIKQKPAGFMFRVFMIGYLLYRFASEFIKPRDFRAIGLSPIQWACLLSAIYILCRLGKLNKVTEAQNSLQ